MKISKENFWQRVILTITICLSVFTTIAVADDSSNNIEKPIEDNINIPKGFISLGDITLFNSTDLIPKQIIDKALVPDEFYDIVKRKYNLDKFKSYPKNKMLYREIWPNNRFGPNNNVNSYENIVLTGNYSIIWTRPLNNTEFKYSQIIDDIDGNSLKDVLTVDYKYNIDTGSYSYILKVRKGTDGSVKWSTSFNGNGWLYGQPIGDINGDKINDIMVKIYDINADSETIKIKRGDNGSTLWQQTIYNGYMYGQPIKDVNGDGLNDIMMTTSDPNANTIKIKKGDTGSTLWSESVNNRYSGIYGESIGDVDGDKLNDISVSTFYNGIGTLKIKKGSTGNTLWSESVNEEGISGWSAGDVDGDGINDIIVGHGECTTGGGTIEIMKGNTFVTLWKESGEVCPIAESIKDVNGDGLNDIIFEINNWYNDIYTLKIKNGNTGNALWSENVNEADWGSYSKPVGDVSGDGLNDIIVKIDLKNDNDTIKIKKGNTGTTLWSESVNNRYSGIYGEYIGDINGDRLNDIAIEREDYIDYDISNYTIKIKKGNTGTTLWSNKIYDGQITVLPAGDLNKDGINDLLLIFNKENSDYNTIYNALVAKKGNNGNTLWKAESNTDIDIGYYTDIYGHNEIYSECYYTIYGGSIKNDLDGDNSGDILIETFNEIYLVATKSSYTNLLKNPGFEESYNSLPRYWSKYQTGTKAIFTYPEIGRTGTGKSVSIKYTYKENGKVGLWRQQGITILPSKQYKLSGYMKLSNVVGSLATPRPGGASIRVTWYKSDGSVIRTDLINKVGTIGWTRYEKTVTSPSNAVKATVGGDLFDSSGKVWFDDLSFVRIS